MTENPQQPKFNFENTSRKWARRFARVQVEMAQRALIISGDALPDLSEAEQKQLNQGRVESASRIFELEDERDALLIEIIEDVPRDWLVSKAPKKIAWDKVEDLDWVLASRFDELSELANTARQDSSKN